MHQALTVEMTVFVCYERCLMTSDSPITYTYASSLKHYATR
jgi:hypothetical protein